jgi:diketogulonate reductase-like aldo/keto reductase
MRGRGVQIESWGPFAEGRNSMFTDPTLTAIGAAHGKTVAQVVLRWLIQREVVAIPKSVRKDRIDAAYRDKYRRYGDHIVGGGVNPASRESTIKLVPR